MSNERTDLLSVVRDIIKDRDEIEKLLPLDEPKFGRWPGKKRKPNDLAGSAAAPIPSETSPPQPKQFKRRV
jgi:hypothetical protein